MTVFKRLRIIRAAFFQRWHERTCGECGATWMAIGRAHRELIYTCDACELENLERFQAFAEREYRRTRQKGVA